MAPTDKPEISGTLRFFNQLGLALQVLRQRAGLSVEALAKRTGVGKSQLSKYENSREFPKLPTLSRILDALEVEPLWFFYLIHQLGREKPVELLKIELLISDGAPMSRSSREGFLRLLSSVLNLHASIAEERSALEGGETRKHAAMKHRKRENAP